MPKEILTMYNNYNPYITRPNTDDISTLLTVQELADFLSIGRNRAYELLRTKEICGFRIGSAWKVSKAAVDQYIMKNSGLL